jgi:hypothetical protein
MRHLKTMTVMVAVLACAGSAWAGDGTAQAAITPPPTQLERPAHFVLADAAPSVDVLIDRFLDALERKDVAAIHRLRVTESEYRTFFLPGSAEPGKPPRVYDDTYSKYAWDMINTNSLYAANQIVGNFGGNKLKVKERKFLKGEQQYAWYHAFKVLDLLLEDDIGRQRELTLGSIADVDGQFKFVGLLGNR